MDQNLTTLNLYHNDIGAEGVRALALSQYLHKDICAPFLEQFSDEELLEAAKAHNDSAVAPK